MISETDSGPIDRGAQRGFWKAWPAAIVVGMCLLVSGGAVASAHRAKRSDAPALHLTTTDDPDFSSFWLAAWWIRERPPIPLYYPHQARGRSNRRIWTRIPNGSMSGYFQPWQEWGTRHDYPTPKFYLYPPIFALAIVPLTLIPIGTAIIVWVAISVLAFVLAMVLLARAWTPPVSRHRVWIAVLIGLSGISYPVLWTLSLRQNSLVLLLLWALSLVALERKREVSAGVALGVLAMIKLSPILLLPWLLWRRYWRTVATAVTCVAVLTVLSVAVAGVDEMRIYFNEVVPLLSTGTHYVENQSLLGVLLRLRSGNDLSAPPAVSEQPSSWLWWGLLAVLIGIQIWCSLRTERTAPAAFRADACAWMMLLLLISPVSWSHHYVIAFIPLLLCGEEALSLQGTRQVLFTAIAGLCFLLIAMPPMPENWSWHPAHPLLLSSRFFGGLILWLLLNLWPGFNLRSEI